MTFIVLLIVQALERLTDIKDKCLDVISFVEILEENFDQFDRVLYHFGNSSFHLSYFDLENYVWCCCIARSIFGWGYMH